MFYVMICILFESFVNLIDKNEKKMYNCKVLYVLSIYNITTYHVELTLDYKTFAKYENDYDLWGELVCLTELSNGYLVLGFGRGLGLTNMIIDIKDNKPKLIEKFEIKNGDYCCRRIIRFNRKNSSEICVISWSWNFKVFFDIINFICRIFYKVFISIY